MGVNDAGQNFKIEFKDSVKTNKRTITLNG